MACYHRSLLWRLLFFGLPVAAFYFLFREVSTWDKPLIGPVAINEGELTEAYRTLALILGAVAAIPYLGLLLRFSDRVQITEDYIRSRRLFTNRMVRWQDLIEYESFPNCIHLSPADESVGIYIDYYMTFRKPKELARVISRKARESDANRSGRRRRRRLLVCELGLLPTIILLVAAGLLLFFFRQRIVFLGVFAGIVLALVSAWIWVTTRRQPDRWKSGGAMYITLFVLLLILPPLHFMQGFLARGYQPVAVFGGLYLVGLMAGSGVMMALLPSRADR
jgi:hypothetical protein